MKRTWLIVGLTVFVSLLILFSLAFSFGRWERLGGSKVALITVDGVILDSKEIIEQLEKYRTNPSVKAIVLRINSPGGGVAPSQEIHEEVLKTRQTDKKPIVASMGSVAASGGYYIASATDLIVANPGTITGSIGVVLQVPNISGLMQKIGVKSVVVKSGLHKDLASPTREMTDAERQILQGMLDDVHGQFIDAVAMGRRIDRKKVETMADGRIFSGREAQSLGLVDQLGNLQDAIERAGALAGIRGKPTVIQERKRGLLLMDLLRGSLSLLNIDVPIYSPSTLSVNYLLW
ncbi:MAG: signal peptide peptidase SppA [Candidatus Methylomirabilis oxygeniifera]|uniref:Signal peptide peptidase SppA, 36K type n=1 Tax=Methylomirabilis oxygeniifera TaxID=671143 RepID=D5MFA2_METO1|nr:MAG: signal peptide peptidase SppA [Candidatus Methylomirabilis oxyfera]CBE68431.1 Signal peptide peptidase SppA, 36K type precursor [Candidatus Methylomirabilis oxyfera]